jgi:hypothetical protein
MQSAKISKSTTFENEEEINWLLQQIRIERERAVKARFKIVTEELPKDPPAKPAPDLWLNFWPI